MASNLKVIIDNPQTKVKIPSGTRMLVRRSCHAVLEHEHFSGQTEVNVVFSDNEMLSDYADKRASDFEAPEVIAVPSETEGSLGTLIISVERILELAVVYNQPFEMGVVFAAVHGVLGLLGQHYLDQRSKDALMFKEAQILMMLGYPPVTGYTDIS